MVQGGTAIDAAWRVCAIRGPSPAYEWWAVEDLVRHGGEVVPHLVAVLDEVVQGGPRPRRPLELLASLLVPDDPATDPDSNAWSAVGSAILDLGGVEFEAQRVEACESELIDPTHFGADWVRESSHGDHPSLTSRGLELARSEDVHTWIG